MVSPLKLRFFGESRSFDRNLGRTYLRYFANPEEVYFPSLKDSIQRGERFLLSLEDRCFLILSFPRKKVIYLEYLMVSVEQEIKGVGKYSLQYLIDRLKSDSQIRRIELECLPNLVTYYQRFGAEIDEDKENGNRFINMKIEIR